ncbi:hypothetical protein PYCC9005_001398 [Savitreella phatthalungensis]
MSASPLQKSISGQSASLLSSDRRASFQSDESEVDPMLRSLSHEQINLAIAEHRPLIEEVEAWFVSKAKDEKHLEAFRQDKCKIQSLRTTSGGNLVDVRLKQRPLMGGHHIIVDGEADDALLAKLQAYTNHYREFDKYFRELERRQNEHQAVAPARHESVEMQVRSLQQQVRGLEGQVRAMKELLAEIYYCPGMPWQTSGQSQQQSNVNGAGQYAPVAVNGSAAPKLGSISAPSILADSIPLGYRSGSATSANHDIQVGNSGSGSTASAGRTTASTNPLGHEPRTAA